MKISIRFKIIALGAILSILATSAAILFSSFTYRNKARASVDNTVDNWLVNVESDFNHQKYGKEYHERVQQIKKYIFDIYDADPEDETEFKDFKEKKNYFKNKYKWVYPIEDFGMYPMSDDEISFRSEYQEMTYMLADAKIATNATSVYLAFIDEARNRLVFLGDYLSYSTNLAKDNEYHLPGSHVDNLNASVSQYNDSIYQINYQGLTTKCYPVVTDDVLDAYFMVEYNYDSVYKSLDEIMRLELITLSITSIVLIAVFAIGAHFLLIRNVVKLTNSSSIFTNNLKSNTSLKALDPEVKSNDEIKDLSNSFVEMENQIIDYIDVIKEDTRLQERMNAELAVSRNIQLESLPNPSFSDSNVNIHSFIRTAKEVGGDFYDYFYITENRLVITMCDVSGKGIPAALFMMKGKELIKSNLKGNQSLEKAIYNANNELCKNNEANLFITAFVAVINVEKQEIKYVNAGHEKPYILSNGEVIKLDGLSNIVLGAMNDFEFKEERHAFNKGSRIFLFTDGLNESINDNEEEFGYQRIEQSLKENINLPIEQMIDKMIHSLDEFTGQKEAFDDVTMMEVELHDNKMELEFDKKDYSIIEEATDKFNNHYSFLNKEILSKASIIIDEVLNNYVSYSKAKEAHFIVRSNIIDSQLVVEFLSKDKKYDPLANSSDKYISSYSDDIKPGGFGVTIIKDLASEVSYQYSDGYNNLIVKMNLVK